MDNNILLVGNEYESVSLNETNISDNTNDLINILAGLDDSEASIIVEANTNINSGRLQGRFVADNVFVIGDKVLSNSEISLLSRGLGFCPTPHNINDYELEQDFREFSRLMRCKYFFRNSARPSLEYHMVSPQVDLLLLTTMKGSQTLTPGVSC